MSVSTALCRTCGVTDFIPMKEQRTAASTSTPPDSAFIHQLGRWFQSDLSASLIMKSSPVESPAPELGLLCLWSPSEPAQSTCSELSCCRFWWRAPTEETQKVRKHNTGMFPEKLTSRGCESTTFWQRLCSCGVSLTSPRSCSWMIWVAVLPDDLHISWNTWEQRGPRKTHMSSSSVSVSGVTYWKTADWPAWPPRRRCVLLPGVPAARRGQRGRQGWNQMKG